MSYNPNLNTGNSLNYAAGASGRPVTYSNYQTGGVAYGAPAQNQGLAYRTDSVQSSNPGVAFRSSANMSYQAPPQPVTNHVTYSNYPATNAQRTTVVNQPQFQPQPQPVRVAADPHYQSKVGGHFHEEDHEVEEKKGFSPSNACWGLLGLLGLIGLILGILFGVGVIGRQDTVIEKIGTNNGTNINTNTNTNANVNLNTNTNTNVNTNANSNSGTTNTNGGSTTTTTNGGSSSTTTNGSTTTTTTNGSTTTTTTTSRTNSPVVVSTHHQLRPAHQSF